MKKIVGVLSVAFCLMLAGCASQKQDTIEKRNTDISKDLTYDHSMELADERQIPGLYPVIS